MARRDEYLMWGLRPLPAGEWQVASGPRRVPITASVDALSSLLMTTATAGAVRTVGGAVADAAVVRGGELSFEPAVSIVFDLVRTAGEQHVTLLPQRITDMTTEPVALEEHRVRLDFTTLLSAELDEFAINVREARRIGNAMVALFDELAPLPPTPKHDPTQLCAIYVVGDRMFIRTSDARPVGHVERAAFDVLDGYPELDASVVGEAVLVAVRRSEPGGGPPAASGPSGYAQPLMSASPGRFSSHRSWQRATRHVLVLLRPEGFGVHRWHPDLGRGSWVPASSSARPTDDWPQEIPLDVDASAEQVGLAVLDVLAQPPLADLY